MAKTISYNRIWKMPIDKNMKRLDLAKSAVRTRVMQIQTTQELDALFLDDNLVD